MGLEYGCVRFCVLFSFAVGFATGGFIESAFKSFKGLGSRGLGFRVKGPFSVCLRGFGGFTWTVIIVVSQNLNPKP